MICLSWLAKPHVGVANYFETGQLPSSNEFDVSAGQARLAEDGHARASGMHLRRIPYGCGLPASNACFYGLKVTVNVAEPGSSNAATP